MAARKAPAPADSSATLLAALRALEKLEERVDKLERAAKDGAKAPTPPPSTPIPSTPPAASKRGLMAWLNDEVA